MQINNNHAYTVIASLNKIYNHAKVYGVLKPKELYLLNIIYKLLNDCDEDCHYTRKKLISLYFKILNSSKLLCKQDNVKDYFYNGNFTTSHVDVNNNTAPGIDNPIPVEPTPTPKPIICNIELTYNSNLDFRWLERNDFVRCYVATTPIKFLKVIALPENGALQINDANAFIGQTIDLNTLNNNSIFIKYKSFLSIGEEDTFKVQVSDSSTIPVYSETTNVNIKVL